MDDRRANAVRAVRDRGRDAEESRSKDWERHWRASGIPDLGEGRVECRRRRSHPVEPFGEVVGAEQRVEREREAGERQVPRQREH